MVLHHDDELVNTNTFEELLPNETKEREIKIKLNNVELHTSDEEK